MKPRFLGTDVMSHQEPDHRTAKPLCLLRLTSKYLYTENQVVTTFFLRYKRRVLFLRTIRQSQRASSSYCLSTYIVATSVAVVYLLLIIYLRHHSRMNLQNLLFKYLVSKILLVREYFIT